MHMILSILLAAIYVFIGVMLYRFVRAMERIADRIDQGLTIRKEDTPR